MTTKPRRIVAALAATLAASTALVAAGGATTGASAAQQQRVNLAFTARSFGASVYTNGIAVKPVRLANSELGCTKTVNRSTSASALDAPRIGDFLKVTGVTSQNRTYRYRNGRTGVRAINRIAQVNLGAEGTPQLVLKGFKSVSDAYKQGGRFRTAGSFTFEGISVSGLPDDGPLGDLLDLIGGGAADVLQELNSGESITIPGLATLSLAPSRGTVTQGARGSAERQTNGLRVKVIPENLASVNLGNTRARVSQPVPAGVFQGGTAAVQGALLDDLAGIGATNATLIPCEGTFNRTVRRSRASGGLASPVVLDVTDARSTIRGSQSGKTGSAFTQATVGRVTILPEQLSPLLPVVRVDDLAARVNVSGNPSKGQVRRTSSFKVGALFVRGERQPLPGVGKSRSYDNGTVVATRRVVRNSRSGAKMVALRVKYLPNVVNVGIDPVTLDLGNASLFFNRG